MSLATWMEKRLGDRRIKKDFIDTYNRGRADEDSGRALVNEGLDSFRALDSEYSERLRSGNVLSPNLDRAFKMAQGQITDTDVRNRRSNIARLQQLRKQTGGALGADQIAELTTGYESEADQQTFESTNQLSGMRAEVEMKETNSLRDRIMAARDRILGTGNMERDRALQQMIAALNLRHGRNAAIGGTFASLGGASMGMIGRGSGGAGSGSGGGITG